MYFRVIQQNLKTNPWTIGVEVEIDLIFRFGGPELYEWQVDFDQLAQSMFYDIRTLAQISVDQRFPAASGELLYRGWQQGSIDILATLVIIGGATYAFLKDYDKIRANAALLRKDLEAHGPELIRLLKERIGIP